MIDRIDASVLEIELRANEAGSCAGDPECLSEVGARLSAFVEEERLALEEPIVAADLACLRRAGIAYLAGLEGYGRVAEAAEVGDFAVAALEVDIAQADLDRMSESLGTCQQEASAPAG